MKNTKKNIIVATAQAAITIAVMGGICIVMSKGEEKRKLKEFKKSN